MDRQEAVQTLSKIGRISVSYAEDLYDSFFEKPVVPQYVADWYEENKGNFELNLHYLSWGLIENLDENVFLNLKPSELDFRRWYHKNKTALQTLVTMHQFGYEVEEEPRYTVRFNNFKAIESYLKKDLVKQKYFLGDKLTSRSIVLNHTRKELEEAGFGWIFSCEGIEVEEVE